MIQSQTHVSVSLLWVTLIYLCIPKFQLVPRYPTTKTSITFALHAWINLTETQCNNKPLKSTIHEENEVHCSSSNSETRYLYLNLKIVLLKIESSKSFRENKCALRTARYLARAIRTMFELTVWKALLYACWE